MVLHGVTLFETTTYSERLPVPSRAQNQLRTPTDMNDDTWYMDKNTLLIALALGSFVVSLFIPEKRITGEDTATAPLTRDGLRVTCICLLSSLVASEVTEHFWPQSAVHSFLSLRAVFRSCIQSFLFIFVVALDQQCHSGRKGRPAGKGVVRRFAVYGCKDHDVPKPNTHFTITIRREIFEEGKGGEYELVDADAEEQQDGDHKPHSE